MRFVRYPLYLCANYITLGMMLVFLCFLLAYKNTDDQNMVNSSCRLAQKGAVSADSEPCEKVGRDILRRKGSAVDAAIATLLCMGVVKPQSSGLGGGFQMVYYNRSKLKAYFLDAREMAPAKATVNMFGGDADRATYGGLSIAVPGEIAGYAEAYRRFGRLPWRELFAPAIKMCREGIVVGEKLAKAILESKDFIWKHEALRNTFLKNGKEPYEVGEIMRRPVLARTLQIIASRGKPALYGHGKLQERFLQDLKAAGSIIDRADLLKYSPRVKTPSKITLRKGLKMYSSTIPSSGDLLTFMLAVLDGYSDLNRSIDKNGSIPVLALQRMVETLKYAYAFRSQMEDSDTPEMIELLHLLTSKKHAQFIRGLINDDETHDPSYYGLEAESMFEDGGTAHLSIISPDGDAVSVTSTINGRFGSMVLSPSTGIILNNQMNDFSLPNISNLYDMMSGTKNQIEPGKRPMSSMAPTIVVDGCGNVQLVVGASGGTKITSSVFQVVARILMFGEKLKESIAAPRFHHQLLPNKLFFEQSFPKEVIEALRQLGHIVQVGFDSGSYVVGIHRESAGLSVHADHKKRG